MIKNFLLVVTIIVVVATDLKAGAWTQVKGEGYFKLGEYFIRADNFYSEPGVTIPLRTTGFYATNLYGEYGVTDFFTVGAYVPFFVRTTLNGIRNTATNEETPGTALNSFGDMDLFIKFRLLQKKQFVMSTSLLLGIPSGTTDGTLQTGDGEVNQMIKFDFGYSAKNHPLYLSTGIGINNRTQDFSEEFRFDFEIGYTIKEVFTAAIKLNGIKSFKNGEALAATTGIFSNDIEFVSLGPEFSYTFAKNWGTNAAVFFAPWGSRVLAAPAYSFGVYYLLKNN